MKEVYRFGFSIPLKDNELRELNELHNCSMTLGEIASLGLDPQEYSNIYRLIDTVHNTIDISLLDVSLGRMQFRSSASIEDNNSLELLVVLNLD